MRVILFGVLTCLLVSEASATAAIDRTLQKLSPEERAHQACAVKGLDVIRREQHLKQADRLMPDTFKRAIFDGSVVTANGAALRATETRWIAVSFTCTVSADQMKATAFTYKMGQDIPPNTWEEVGLWR